MVNDCCLIGWLGMATYGKWWLTTRHDTNQWLAMVVRSWRRTSTNYSPVLSWRYLQRFVLTPRRQLLGSAGSPLISRCLLEPWKCPTELCDAERNQAFLIRTHYDQGTMQCQFLWSIRGKSTSENHLFWVNGWPSWPRGVQPFRGKPLQ